MARVTYVVGLRRYIYGFNMHVRLRFRVMQVGNQSCGAKSWPNIQDAGDAVSLNEDALILW